MLRFIISSVVAFSLFGCANNQGLAPNLGTDRHSGSKTVLMQPHGADCKTMQCIAIGAFWTESAKDKALLTVSLLNTTDFIRDAYLEIDGVKVPLRDDGDLTSYERPYSNLPGVANSRKEYIVSLDVIRKLTSAKKAWIFVQTGSGYMSDAIIDSQGDSKAYYAMQRFLSAIPK